MPTYKNQFAALPQSQLSLRHSRLNPPQKRKPLIYTQQIDPPP